MTYALGRGVEEYDRPVLRKIMRETTADEPSLVVHHSRDRQEHAISDEEGQRCDH